MTTGWEDGIADLTERLIKSLSDGKSVLWLVSGGSNIAASVQIMDSISLDLRQNLTVTLADERYGEAGHPDSNWQQLLDAGFSTDNVRIKPVLEQRDNPEKTAKRYDEMMRTELSNNDEVIAQLGIGPDGHIAGILPDSEACKDTNQYVIGYDSEPFDRLTITFKAFQKITCAYVFAFGYTKKETLEALATKNLDLCTQPAQILKQLKKACVYNDQVGEHN